MFNDIIKCKYNKLAITFNFETIKAGECFAVIGYEVFSVSIIYKG